MRRGKPQCAILLLAVAVRAERLPIKIYTTADGLARNSVEAIVSDSRGFLWICTVEGLSRFDGYQFTNYGTDEGLPSRSVSAFLETRRGDYWVGTTAGGLCRFHPKRSGGPRFEIQHLGEARQTREVTSLLEDHNGTVWCGTHAGLFRVTPAVQSIDIGMPNAIDDDRVTTLLEDRAGTLWVGSMSGLYRRSPDGTVRRYTVQDGLPHDHIRALLEDRKGYLWAGTWNGLCRVSPGAAGTPLCTNVYTKRDGLAGNLIEALLETSSGKLLVGTEHGFSEFLTGGGAHAPAFRSYTSVHGVGGRVITSLAEDREGNLWMGTTDGGAMRMTPSGFTTYTEADGIGSQSTGFALEFLESRAGELCALSKGDKRLFVNRFDGDRFTAIPSRLPRRITYLGWGWNQVGLQDHTGEWWIATGQGVARFPRASKAADLAATVAKTVYTMRDGLPRNDVFRLFEDSRGDVWISTIGHPKNGITRWDRSTGKLQCHSETLLAFSFGQDSAGAVWLGLGGSVARYRNSRFEIFGPADGMPPGDIVTVYWDDAGRIWLASRRSGLIRVDHPADERPRFVTYSTAQGLSSNDVICLTGDRFGHIYAGTGRGVDRIEPATGSVKHYTTADGLAAGILHSAYCDRYGALWFAATQGVSRFMPQPDRPKRAPPVLITGVRIRGTPQSISDLGETELSGLRLKPNENQLQIDFVGLGFALGETLRYQYLLEGADRDWSALSGQRSVNYASLSPGSYRFLVRSVNAEGLGSVTPASLAFTILPPLWQRWWFLTFAAVAASLAIYSLHRYRVARLLELERVRMRIATDLHDEVGAHLSQIAILSEVARVEATDAKAQEPLFKIAGLSRELVDSMGDIVWAIRPRHDGLVDLVQRMREYAGEIFVPHHITFEFRTRCEERHLKLSLDARRQILLILKECVTNIVRHANATNACIDFEIERGWVVLKVSDDGKGFEVPDLAAQPGRRHGLTGMRWRAKTLGGDLTVNSDEGVTVTLRVPLRTRVNT